MDQQKQEFIFTPWLPLEINGPILEASEKLKNTVVKTDYYTEMFYNSEIFIG